MNGNTNIKKLTIYRLIKKKIKKKFLIYNKILMIYKNINKKVY